MQMLPYEAGPAGDVIAPYVQGGYFVKDFYMKDRIGAMAGASVKQYNEANIILAGTPYKETHILGPEQPNKYWTEVMTTSADIGWNPLGEHYNWNPLLDDSQNAHFWFEAGRPHKNAYGEWGGLGVPIESEIYGRLSPKERLEKYPDGSPMGIARRNARGNKKPSRWQGFK